MNPFLGKKKLGSIGLPLPNTDIKLLDPSTGKEVKLGEAGEICAKGPQVMTGYYNKPEETKNAIDKNGYMHTGDVAIMDKEGYMRIVDRTKDMIIVGGYKVFSVKVEDVMSEHPAIDMVGIVGLENPDRPGSETVKAFVQLVPGYSGDREALKKDILDFAKKKLAPYEVPKTVEFMDELPLTPVGKLDKKVLRK
jgi:long-chain acyl-CoA synthetase